MKVIFQKNYLFLKKPMVIIGESALELKKENILSKVLKYF